MKLKIVRDENVPASVLEQLAYDTQRYFSKDIEIDVITKPFKAPSEGKIFKWNYAEIKYGKGLTENLTNYDAIEDYSLGGLFPNLARIVKQFNEKREFLKEYIVLFTDSPFSYLPDFPFTSVGYHLSGRLPEGEFYYNFAFVGDLKKQAIVLGGVAHQPPKHLMKYMKVAPGLLKFNGFILAQMMETLANEAHMTNYINNKGMLIFDRSLSYKNGCIKDMVHHLSLEEGIDKIKETYDFNEMMNIPIKGLNCPPDD